LAHATGDHSGELRARRDVIFHAMTVRDSARFDYETGRIDASALADCLGSLVCAKVHYLRLKHDRQAEQDVLDSHVETLQQLC